jgi:hypothetical protein
MAENLTKMFEKVGLSSQKAAETVANKKISAVFERILTHVFPFW